MVKVKRKVEMNLPELIEWGWENPKQVERRTFKSDKRDSFGKNAEIYFTNCGHGFYTHRVTDKDTFTVEVEEEITEDTVISEMLTVYDRGITHLTNNKSLNDLIKANLKSAYIMNDDLRLILIWRDGRLIE